MNWFWFSMMICLASPALAGPVRITSGEHDGFTRLVLDYGRPVDWQVGRSADGYQLRLTNEIARYDVSAAFDLIGKSRLAAIWAAPDTGQLNIGLSCACHAIPFEFRPGIVVIDLKDGPPPKGSSFEMGFDGASNKPIAASAPPRPRSRPDGLTQTKPKAEGLPAGYNWVKAAYPATGNPSQPLGVDLPDNVAAARIFPPPGPELQPLRTSILHQMARGAAQGVIELAPANGQNIGMIDAAFPTTQMRIGNAATSIIESGRSTHGDLGARGANCVLPASLDIALWGDEKVAFVDQMALMRANLSGEFDKPDAEAVARAVKFHLYLGFGAEARQMLEVFDQVEGAPSVWRALGHLIDDQADPEGIFDGQAACAGPAALWSFLANPKVAPGDPIDAGSIQLAFSALPLHLRRLLGPRLAERFLAVNDQEGARAVRNAIVRAPGDAGGAVRLMEAGIDLHIGDAAEAETIAKTVMGDAGPDQPEALIAYTEARIAQKLPVTPQVALSIQAHLNDVSGTELESRLQDALILAQAASGDITAAFNGLKAHPARQADVWTIAASLAPDDSFLTYAVLETAARVPDVPPETAATIARRLTELGLGDAALQWLSVVENADPLLIAATALNRKDGQAALIPLVGGQDAPGQEMRLRALDLLGENLLRADILQDLGDLTAASTAIARAGDWQRLAISGEEPWSSLARRLEETPPPAAAGEGMPYGSLARGYDLAEAGAGTRAAIAALLETVPAPVIDSSP